VVIDTNVLVGALRKFDGLNRKIFEMVFKGDIFPVVGDALYFEYESLIGREGIYIESSLSFDERCEFLDAFCAMCKWVDVYYKWRPNLRDEGDNHVVELGLAANAPTILSWNKKDFKGADLNLPDIQVLTPREFLFGEDENKKKERGAWQH
jgi:predicted nucleic acid-binding protein